MRQDGSNGQQFAFYQGVHLVSGAVGRRRGGGEVDADRYVAIPVEQPQGIDSAKASQLGWILRDLRVGIFGQPGDQPGSGIDARITKVPAISRVRVRVL